MPSRGAPRRFARFLPWRGPAPSANLVAMDLERAVERYGAAWGETDEAARRKVLEEVWAENGLYCDPTARVEGREAFVAHIGGFHETFPGARIDLASGADEHDGYFRFAWTMVGADGATVVDGFDVGHRGDDGRIDLIVGFFGPFPARGA